MTRCSIIIPAYNAERYLAETVASVRAQRGVDWELIIVDDGSTDATAARAASLAADDPRVRFYEQANAGVSAARNRGLALSDDGRPFVMFLDADDVLVPDAISTLAATLATRPDASAAHGAATFIDASGATTSGSFEMRSRRAAVSPDGRRLVQREPGDDTDADVLAFANSIAPGQVLIRRTALALAGPFDPSVSPVEDWDMWYRLATRAGPIASVPVATLAYRVHAGSASTNRLRMRRAQARLRLTMLARAQGREERRRLKAGQRLLDRRLLGSAAAGLFAAIRAGELRRAMSAFASTSFAATKCVTPSVWWYRLRARG